MKQNLLSALSSTFSRKAPREGMVDEREATIQRLQESLNGQPRRQHEQMNMYLRSQGYETNDFVPAEFVSYLRGFSSDTLAMVERHERPSDFSTEFFGLGESRVRNSLLIAPLTKLSTKCLPAYMVDDALIVMRGEIDFSDDLASLKADELAVIITACDFVVRLHMNKHTCPRGAASVVFSRPERMLDVLAYTLARTHPGEDNSIDLKALEEFLDGPAQSLRDGTL